MKKLILLIFASFIGVSIYALDTLRNDRIRELSVHLLEDSMKANSKPILIYYTASWCKWCKMLEGNVLIDSIVVDSINKSYYFVKFDGEYKKDVKFLGRTYSYVKTGDNKGYHEFCMVFDKITVYPSLVFLTNHFELKETVVGYLSTEDLIKKIK